MFGESKIDGVGDRIGKANGFAYLAEIGVNLYLAEKVYEQALQICEPGKKRSSVSP